MHNPNPENTTESHEYRRGDPLWSPNRHQAKKVETDPLVVGSVGAGVELRGVGTLVVARRWGCDHAPARGELPTALAPTEDDGLVLSLMHIGDPLWSPRASASPNMYPARDAERSQHAFDQETITTKNQQAACPIGVFDSGAGGLTILSALRQELPYEHYVYFGDTAHCPYGMRSDAEIIALSQQACQFLIEQGAKLIVVACNTASQAALNTLRASFSIPFVGVVPAVKPAARATKKGRIGVAATNQAAKALYLHQLIDEFADGIEVYAVGCPELVTLVEKGELDGPVVEEAVRQAFQPLFNGGVDVIVLGCTHFPALRPVIERITEHRVQIIDSGSAIARRTHSVLDAEALIRHANLHSSGGELQIWCSGDSGAFSTIASRLLGYPVVASQSRI